MTNRHILNYKDFCGHFRVEDGKLIRLQKTKRTPANHVVGYKNLDGYLIFGFKNKYYFVHRVIYLLTHGECPVLIDHINGDISDNRPENLRAADFSQNGQNRSKTRTTTGVKGVHKLKANGKYQAYIKCGGKRQNLGTFASLEEAALVATQARNNLHGQFANHGVYQ